MMRPRGLSGARQPGTGRAAAGPATNSPPRSAPWSLVRATAATCAIAFASSAAAQLQVRVEVPYGVTVGSASVGGVTSPEAGLVTGVRLDAEARLDPVTATLRLHPSMSAGSGLYGAPAPSFDPFLTEAFVLVREGAVDLSAGIQRLPLETARLSVPYQVDGVAADGSRDGLLGARASVYVGPVRIRGALLERAGSIGGAASLRLDLTSAQLEGHVVALDGLAFGASASGTVADTVLYGEGWLLTDPLRGRGAVGASGFLGDALWTLEAAFAPPPGLPTASAVPQLLGQISVPAGDNGSFELAAGASLVPSVLTPGRSALASLATFSWVTGDPDTQLELGPSVQTSELGTHYALTLRLTTFTSF